MRNVEDNIKKDWHLVKQMGEQCTIFFSPISLKFNGMRSIDEETMTSKDVVNGSYYEELKSRHGGVGGWDGAFTNNMFFPF
ncbi:hypothetical protein IFM89_012733 [Coptis chinensis]|uniref:Uncharacterized protein n=1 Tax=Coptis chinensis TaxID=261450 RepID=A0A835HCK8_9MAGN|nr:hypothetical protein IFM89_012733 [Coptis chinensis]